MHDLYSSQNIVSLITSRRMRWNGHVARMREIRNAYKNVVGKLQGRDHLGDLSVGRRFNITMSRQEAT
jgi:hypothetical protein